jgi:hypothetical protein
LSSEAGFSNFSWIYLPGLFSAIHLDEIVVYETIPSNYLDQELKDYLKNHGVRLNHIYMFGF